MLRGLISLLACDSRMHSSEQLGMDLNDYGLVALALPDADHGPVDVE